MAQILKVTFRLGTASRTLYFQLGLENELVVRFLTKIHSGKGVDREYEILPPDADTSQLVIIETYTNRIIRAVEDCNKELLEPAVA